MPSICLIVVEIVEIIREERYHWTSVMKIDLKADVWLGLISVKMEA